MLYEVLCACSLFYIAVLHNMTFPLFHYSRMKTSLRCVLELLASHPLHLMHVACHHLTQTTQGIECLALLLTTLMDQAVGALLQAALMDRAVGALLQTALMGQAAGALLQTALMDQAVEELLQTALAERAVGGAAVSPSETGCWGVAVSPGETDCWGLAAYSLSELGCLGTCCRWPWLNRVLWSSCMISSSVHFAS